MAFDPDSGFSADDSPGHTAWLIQVPLAAAGRNLLRPGVESRWPMGEVASLPAIDNPIFFLDPGPMGGLLARGRVVASQTPKTGGKTVRVLPTCRPSTPLTLGELIEGSPLAEHEIVYKPDGTIFPLTAEQYRFLDQCLAEPAAPIRLELADDDIGEDLRQVLESSGSLSRWEGAEEIGHHHLLAALFDKTPDSSRWLDLVGLDRRKLIRQLETFQPPSWLDTYLAGVDLPVSKIVASALARAMGRAAQQASKVSADDVAKEAADMAEEAPAEAPRSYRGTTVGAGTKGFDPGRDDGTEIDWDVGPENAEHRELPPKGGFSVGPEPTTSTQTDPPPPPPTTPSTDEAAVETTTGRRLRTRFRDQHGPLDADRPLDLEGRFWLEVGIDAREWGIGKPGRTIDDQVDEEDWKRHDDVLPLRVAVRSETATATPAIHPLPLPRHGPSPRPWFALDLCGRSGRHGFDVDLLFEGRLLQSRRVEVQVVARAGDSVPSSVWPVQDAWPLFEGVDELAPTAIEALGRRKVSIVVERSKELIGLRFYRWDGTELAFHRTRLDAVNLGKQIDGVRQLMSTIMEGYTGGVGGGLDRLARALWELADAGRSFYRSLLPLDPEEAAPLARALAECEVVQVAPLSPQVGVPWEILYDRKIGSWRPGRSRLCPGFVAAFGDVEAMERWRASTAETCADCAGLDDVVCPRAFWGFTRVVEQLPYRVDPALGKVRPPIAIGGALPLCLLACTSRDLGFRHDHLAHLRQLDASRLQVVEADELDDLLVVLRDAPETLDCLYFYAHGGTDRMERPFLEIGDGEPISENDLELWGLRFEHRRPLLVLNVCDSANYTPASFENLIQAFYDRGAAGIVATQCDIRELLADAVGTALLRHLLTPSSVGHALLRARNDLLAQGDPRGLVYSLFADAELRLAGLDSQASSSARAPS